MAEIYTTVLSQKRAIFCPLPYFLSHAYPLLMHVLDSNIRSLYFNIVNNVICCLEFFIKPQIYKQCAYKHTSIPIVCCKYSFVSPLL